MLVKSLLALRWPRMASWLLGFIGNGAVQRDRAPHSRFLIRDNDKAFADAFVAGFRCF